MERFKIVKATRKRAKARIGISGPSGSGKTYSSLLIAFGLVSGKENPRIGVIDTEQHSAELYAPEFEEYGGYYVINLEPPFDPQKYIKAIKTFEENNFDVIIIDSLSHAWAGTGGLLDIHGKIVDSGTNPFMAWREVTPQHNKLVEAMLQSPCHIIATLRAKTEYVIQDVDGKKQVIKVGLSPIQRDGMEYEFMTFFELSYNHTCRATKDRTGLFDNMIFTPSIETGKKIKEFLDSGIDAESQLVKEIEQAIQRAQSLEELKTIWEKYYEDMTKFSKVNAQYLVRIKNQRKQELTTCLAGESTEKETANAINTINSNNNEFNE